jgi:hypothetical protein
MRSNAMLENSFASERAPCRRMQCGVREQDRPQESRQAQVNPIGQRHRARQELQAARQGREEERRGPAALGLRDARQGLRRHGRAG